MDVNYVKINVVADVDSKYANEIFENILAEFKNNNTADGVSIDLKNEYTFDVPAVRTLAQISVHVKKIGKKLNIRNAKKDLKNLVKELGLSSIQFIDNSKQTEELQQKTMENTKKLDVNFINPFIEGVLETLKVQCGVVCHHDKPLLKENYKASEAYAIAGVIGLTSESFKGSISICFPEKTFIGIMSKMLGETYEKITDELEDGAGEILNISFGMAKKNLNEKGYKIDKAIPTVIRGESVVVKHLVQGKTIVLPFRSDLGVFCVEIAIEEESK